MRSVRGKAYSQSDTDYILKHYEFVSIEVMAEKLGRTMGSVELKLYRMRRDGVIENNSGYKYYTQRELKYIEKHYKFCSCRAIAEKLGRTTKAIELTVVRMREKEGMTDEKHAN